MAYRAKFKSNPKILASFDITESNSGEYLKNLISTTDLSLNSGLVIKNNSDDRLVIAFEDSGELSEFVILGNSELNFNIKTIDNITLSRLESNDISVSVYGR
jgi:hypothetical protein